MIDLVLMLFYLYEIVLLAAELLERKRKVETKDFFKNRSLLSFPHETLSRLKMTSSKISGSLDSYKLNMPERF